LASYTRTLDEETMTTRVREDIVIEVLKDFPAANPVLGEGIRHQ
jgi:hypothetical protein